MKLAPTRTRRIAVAELGRTYLSSERSELRGLMSKLSALVRGPHVAAVVLDLAGVEDFGAGLVGALIRLHAEAAALGKPVALCGLSESARGVLRLTKLDRVWLLGDNRAAALVAVGGGQALAAASL